MDGVCRQVQSECLDLLFNFEDIVKNYQENTRGCSSDGRAPALQAGGHEFDSRHLHRKGRIAQVVRAHA